jgi:hypothetical protein
MQGTTLWICGVQLVTEESEGHRKTLIHCLQLLDYRQEEVNSNIWFNGNISVEFSPFDFTITTPRYIESNSFERCDKNPNWLNQVLHIVAQHFVYEIGKDIHTGCYLQIGTKSSEIAKVLRELDPRLAWDAVRFINTQHQEIRLTRRGEKSITNFRPYEFPNPLAGPCVARWTD